MKDKIIQVLKNNITESKNDYNKIYERDFDNLANELLEAINYTRCSLQLKDKKAFTFEDWLYKHQIKKIDRLYFAKDGTEQEFNSLHRRYVQTLQSL